MATVRRSIIHFDPDVLRALRLHAATSGRNLSEVVNEMVWRAMEVTGSLSSVHPL